MPSKSPGIAIPARATSSRPPPTSPSRVSTGSPSLPPSPRSNQHHQQETPPHENTHPYFKTHPHRTARRRFYGRLPCLDFGPRRAVLPHCRAGGDVGHGDDGGRHHHLDQHSDQRDVPRPNRHYAARALQLGGLDRKSTRLNSSH